MRTASTAVAFALLVFTGSAGAHPRDACVSASTRAQELRDAHALSEARRELLVCADASCPNVVRRDCATWLEETERSLATLIVTVRDERGAPIARALVRVDGSAPNDVREPIFVDPGEHVVRAESEGHVPSERRITAAAGARSIPVDLALAPAAVLAPPPPAPSGAKGSAWTTVGWTVIGVGGAALLVGGVFGGLAIASQSAAACDATFACDPEPLARARAQALLSTVAFVTGGVLVAAGATFVLVGAARGARRSVALGPWGFGLALTGSF